MRNKPLEQTLTVIAKVVPRATAACAKSDEASENQEKEDA